MPRIERENISTNQNNPIYKMNKRCGWWGSEDQWRNGSTGHKGNEDMNNFLWQQNSCPCGKYWAEADWWQWWSDEGARPSYAAEHWTAFLPCQGKGRIVTISTFIPRSYQMTTIFKLPIDQFHRFLYQFTTEGEKIGLSNKNMRSMCPIAHLRHSSNQ